MIFILLIALLLFGIPRKEDSLTVIIYELYKKSMLPLDETAS